MLNKLLFIILLSFGFNVWAEVTAKISTIEEASKLTNSIIDIAKKNQLSKKSSNVDLDVELNSIYAATYNVDALIIHAENCFLYMRPGNPEDQLVDEVFEAAWKKAISRIGKIGNTHAKEVLTDLLTRGNYDGGFSLFLKSVESNIK